MPEPVYSATTERIYANLPEYWRTQDSLVSWELKKFIASVADQMGDVDVMVDRFDYDALPDGVPGDTSDLVDPMVADAAWLPWLAQLVGQKIVTSDVALTRSKIASANKFKAGTKMAMAEAAKAVLTGEQRINIYDHSITTALNDGGQWDLLIVTKATETTSSPAAEIIRVGAKPAGIVLHEATFETTWSAIESGLPTWADWEAAGSWRAIEETGL